MKTVSDLITLSNHLYACPPAMRYLANLEPSAPVELAFDKLPCDEREWIVWLIDRTIYHHHQASMDMRDDLHNVIRLIAQFELQKSALYERMRELFRQRLDACATNDEYWAVYDGEFRPEFSDHVYALWSAEYVPQIRPIIVQWLHALEVQS